MGRSRGEGVPQPWRNRRGKGKTTAWADVSAVTWRMGTPQNENSKEGISGAGVGGGKSTAGKTWKGAEVEHGQQERRNWCCNVSVKMM